MAKPSIELPLTINGPQGEHLATITISLPLSVINNKERTTELHIDTKTITQRFKRASQAFINEFEK